LYKLRVFTEWIYRAGRDLLYRRLGPWIVAYCAYLESSNGSAHEDINSTYYPLRSSVSLAKLVTLPLDYTNLNNSAGVAAIIRIPYTKMFRSVDAADDILLATK
jgi:hypothetical protein